MKPDFLPNPDDLTIQWRSGVDLCESIGYRGETVGALLPNPSARLGHIMVQMYGETYYVREPPIRDFYAFPDGRMLPRKKLHLGDYIVRAIRDRYPSIEFEPPTPQTKEEPMPAQLFYYVEPLQTNSQPEMRRWTVAADDRNDAASQAIPLMRAAGYTEENSVSVREVPGVRTNYSVYI